MSERSANIQAKRPAKAKPKRTKAKSAQVQRAKTPRQVRARLIESPGGLPIVHEASGEIPLVDFAIYLRAGSVNDPAGQEGTARMLARLLRRGTKKLSAAQVDEQIALLGGRLVFSTGRDVLRAHASVLARNVEPFVALISSLLREPALRSADLQRERRRIVADLIDARDDDGAVAGRHMRDLLYGDHPYALPVGGTLESVRRIKLAAVKTQHAAMLKRGNLLFASAGAIEERELGELIDRHFGGLPKGKSKFAKLPTPKVPKGRRVRIVHKPDRSQTQLGISCLGPRRDDPLLPALSVGDCAFGGLFSSRLVNEVRAKRGWSYSAQSMMRVGEQRGSWALWTHPAVANALECAELELSLMDEFVAKGPSAAETAQAKRYLIGSRCLDEDTPSRRVELATEAEYSGQGVDYPAGYAKRIRAVKRADVADAFGRRIDVKNVAIVAVGDAKELQPRFEALTGVSEVEVVPVG